RAQKLRQFAQDAQDLVLLFFAQANQLIVQVDGLERLDEERVSAAAGAVDDAVNLALLARDYRHHETIVAKRDELFLQCSVVVMSAQKSFERNLDLALLLVDIAAQALQRHAGIVGQRRVGKDLAAEVAEYGARIED